MFLPLMWSLSFGALFPFLVYLFPFSCYTVHYANMSPKKFSLIFNLWGRFKYSQLFGLNPWILWLMASFLQNCFLTLFQNSQAGIWYCGMFPACYCRLLSMVLWRIPVSKDHSENHNYLFMMTSFLFLRHPLLSAVSIVSFCLDCWLCISVWINKDGMFAVFCKWQYLSAKFWEILVSCE